MASDLNKTIIIGRLTKDPELRTTQNGTPVCSFTIANNRTYVAAGEKKESVNFFNCVAWAKTGEVIAEHCKKGQRMGIEGRLQQRTWDDQDGKKHQVVEIVVDNFQFLSPPANSQGGPAPATDNPFSDDDIPF